ncbi:hypothetical protein AAG570_005410 [Ranatra chinensis]|uniref:Uncharacterized protein n=1 Tax=Ranatra chinensis TaxID=642074 RepID=A0ABD0Y0E8_9HEMI
MAPPSSVLWCFGQLYSLRMASKGPNTFGKDTEQETTEIGTRNLSHFCVNFASNSFKSAGRERVSTVLVDALKSAIEVSASRRCTIEWGVVTLLSLQDAVRRIGSRSDDAVCGHQAAPLDPSLITLNICLVSSTLCLNCDQSLYPAPLVLEGCIRSLLALLKETREDMDQLVVSYIACARQCMELERATRDQLPQLDDHHPPPANSDPLLNVIQYPSPEPSSQTEKTLARWLAYEVTPALPWIEPGQEVSPICGFFHHVGVRTEQKRMPKKGGGIPHNHAEV